MVMLMVETETKVKKWGSSLGVIIPSDAAKKARLREGEKIIIEIKKKRTMREFFGRLKGWKIDSQKMKDELRKEWNK